MTDVEVRALFVLLAAFQAKHLLADYFLQGGYMLRKFLDGWEFFLPLAAHCLVHAAMTFALAYAAGCDGPLSTGLALANGSVHFVVDRLKAGNRYFGRWKALSSKEFHHATDRQKRENTRFWWALGVDQWAHHMTDLACVYAIATRAL